MSVAGLMLVRDEVDIIQRSVLHAREQVDWLLVADNRSTDGTFDALDALHRQGIVDHLLSDPEVAYEQSRKMTNLARIARERGHKWVVPIDADELWTTASGEGTVASFLRSQAPNVQIVTAALYDYLPPSQGLDGLHPFAAITWRRIAPGAFPKVAARVHPYLVIEPGNHGAHYATEDVLRVPGLMVRHFTWRSPEQYLRKIRNGLEAYAASTVDPMYGAHWRMWEGRPDEAVLAHYHEWFEIDYPPEDDELTYDPVIE